MARPRKKIDLDTYEGIKKAPAFSGGAGAQDRVLGGVKKHRANAQRK